MAMSKQDKNNAVISALGHPIRRQILRYLGGNLNGGASPKMFADETGAQLPTVSYHFRELARLGVVKLVKTAPRRGAIEHFYKRSGTVVDAKVSETLKSIGKD